MVIFLSKAMTRKLLLANSRYQFLQVLLHVVIRLKILCSNCVSVIFLVRLLPKDEILVDGTNLFGVTILITVKCIPEYA